MSAVDLASVVFLLLAVGDIALLLGNRESKLDWALRLVMAAALAIVALLFHRRDFDLPYLVVLALLVIACQAALVWRRIADLKRGPGQK